MQREEFSSEYGKFFRYGWDGNFDEKKGAPSAGEGPLGSFGFRFD